MVPTMREIAMQIAVAHEMHPKKTISELASMLALSPLFIINALDEGEKMELFMRDKDKDMLIQANTIDHNSSMGLDFGIESTRLQNEILRAVASANTRQMDIESGTLTNWCRGINPGAVEIAIHVLKKLSFIDTYKLNDPSDKKTEYEFLTLKVNLGHEWGKKQFKSTNKKKKDAQTNEREQSNN